MTVFLFPGQGSQAPGMGRDLYEGSDAVREIFDQAKSLSPPGFLDIMFRGTEVELADTRIAQPALLTVSAAVTRVLEEAGVRPRLCAGHSLGEFSALVAAGSLEFPAALNLVHERARCMSENVPEGGMAAVIGLDAAKIESSLPAGAEIANYNGPQQTIISGSLDGLERAEPALKQAGAKRVVRLQVSGPFHSSLMRAAADRFRRVLESVSIYSPKAGFISSVSGQEVTEPATIRALLAEQICAPVRWTDVMLAIGSQDAIEAGSGRVLQGLAKRIDGGPQVVPAGTLEACSAVAASMKAE